MNRMRFIIIAAFISLVLIVSLVFRRPPSPATKPGAAITPHPINPSVLPPPIESGSITYSGGPSLTFPKEVPYYTVTRHKDFNAERERLVALFNISAPAETFSGSRGKYTNLNWNGKFGILSESPLAFSYTQAGQTDRFVTNDVDAYRDIALGAITELSMLPKPFVLSPPQITYLSIHDAHPTQLPDSQGAHVAQLNFSVQIESLPVFFSDADTPAFSISINGYNQITVFRGFFLPDIAKAPQPASVISYDEALSRLKSNKGILSSLSLARQGEYEFMTGEVPDFIEVESASLGYFYSKNQDYLIPVFVFTGKAREPGSSAVLQTTTIVSAL